VLNCYGPRRNGVSFIAWGFLSLLPFPLFNWCRLHESSLIAELYQKNIDGTNVVGECFASPMVAVLLGYTCDVLQCWNIPQAKHGGGLRPVEERKSYSYTETFSPFREYELAGMGLLSRLPCN
jgi:hypothetical protein